MSSDVLEDAGEGARFDGVMVRDNFVILAVSRCGYADMGAGLARYLIAQNSQVP